MKVTINGAGITGLTTALALQAQRHLIPNLQLQILEKRAYPDPQINDFGVNLLPAAVKTLDDLGLMKEVIGNSWAPMYQKYFTKDGKMIANSPRGIAQGPKSYPQISIHHNKLRDILENAVRNKVGPDTVFNSVEGISYTQDDNGVSYKYENSDGNSFEGKSDVFIAADGINSKIRKCMLEGKGIKEGDPIKSGLTIYRGSAFFDKVEDGNSVILAGHSKAKLVCYPLEAPRLVTNLDGTINQKQATAFAVEIADEGESLSLDATKEELANYIADKLEELNKGLNLPFVDHRKLLLSATSIRVEPIVDRDPLDTCADGFVNLIANAAHPMYPTGSSEQSINILSGVEIAARIASGCNGKKDFDREAVKRCLREMSEQLLPNASEVQMACRNMLPEQVMDRVFNEGGDPSKYQESMLEAIAKVQGGLRKNIQSIEPVKKADSGTLRMPVAFSNQVIVQHFSPIERVLLAANGQLQRTMAAMCNVDVVVKPIVTRMRNELFLDREVHLKLDSEDGPHVTTCILTVIPHSNEMKERMLSNSVGIGQIVAERRRTGRGEPDFKLVAAGKKGNILTRQYVLDIPNEITFLLYEDIFLDILFGSGLGIDSEMTLGM